jgi:hypothetical protein
LMLNRFTMQSSISKDQGWKYLIIL